MSRDRKNGRYCACCKQVKPTTAFTRHRTGGLSVKCKECAETPVAKINIDRVLAAQFLGVQHDMSEPYACYAFGDERASFNARHNPRRTRV